MLNDKAALIVIAVPTKVVDSSTGRGIETSFKVLTVLKGERDIGQLVLHHYALSPAATIRSPLLVPYKPEDKRQFLMFLQKERMADMSRFLGWTTLMILSSRFQSFSHDAAYEGGQS